jgi:hypothetical protein
MVGIGILFISLTVSVNAKHLDLLLGINEGMMDEVSVDIDHLDLLREVYLEISC